MSGQSGKANIQVLVPLFGILLFAAIYLTAASLYPGGSQADTAAKGFSWLHNYWCNLLNEHAINGEPNTARPVAIAGMFILALSMSVFWFQFGRLTKLEKATQRLIRFSGIISMCTGFFLFTGYHHDAIINITGLLAAFAFAGTFAGLYKMRWRRLFWFGIFNLVLIALNNFIYYTGGLIAWLPIVQKITFFFFLTWICLIDIRLYILADQKNLP
ncbi:MAG: hypothetical protein ABIQ31_22510 [Ferruginibacter sp.]